jgi:hypothetical protein
VTGSAAIAVEQAVDQNVIALDKAIPRTVPFLHFVSPQFYTEGFAETLLTWLETGADWQLKETTLFEQYQLGFNDFRHCREIAGLWDGAVLADFRDKASRAFGVKLSSRINISAHKLLPGQFGGIHTDNVPGETHRVVVQLNRGRAPDSGGNLVFLSGPSPNDLAVAFKQISNSAAGFLLGPNSYHAITRVKSGTRFTIIYTFLSEAARDSEYRYFHAA